MKILAQDRHFPGQVRILSLNEREVCNLDLTMSDDTGRRLQYICEDSLDQDDSRLPVLSFFLVALSAVNRKWTEFGCDFPPALYFLPKLAGLAKILRHLIHTSPFLLRAQDDDNNTLTKPTVCEE